MDDVFSVLYKNDRTSVITCVHIQIWRWCLMPNNSIVLFHIILSHPDDICTITLVLTLMYIYRLGYSTCLVPLLTSCDYVWMKFKSNNFIYVLLVIYYRMFCVNLIGKYSLSTYALKVFKGENDDPEISILLELSVSSYKYPLHMFKLFFSEN